MQQQTLFEMEPLEPSKEEQPAPKKSTKSQDAEGKAGESNDAPKKPKASKPKEAKAKPAKPQVAEAPVVEPKVLADPDTDYLQTDLADLELEQFLCFALYTANHAMNRVYKPLLQELGLTYPQYLAMTVLWQKDKILVGELGDRLHLESNTVTPLLKRLETMDLLTRTRDKKDERQVRVALTRKGKALKAKTTGMGACILKATGLPAKKAVTLQNLIVQLRDNMLDATAED